MPVGGRLKRTDKIRSKPTPNHDEENQPENEIIEEKIPGLKYLAMVKARKSLAITDIINETSKEDIIKPTDENKEIEIKPVSNFRGRQNSKNNNQSNIENHLLISKMEVDDEVNETKAFIENKVETKLRGRINSKKIEQIHKTDAVEISNIEEDEELRTVKSIPKRSAKKNAEKLVLTTIEYAPQIKSKKEDENKDTDVIINESKSIKAKDTPTKSRVLKKINAPEFMEVVEEEVITPSNDIIKDTTTVKSRGRKARVVVTDVVDNQVVNEDMEIDDIELSKKIEPSKTIPSEEAVKTKDLPVVAVKIPGLALLQNLKARKSGLLDATKDESTLKIPGLESTKNIRQRKSMLLKESEPQTEALIPIASSEVVPSDLPPKGPGGLRRRTSTLNVHEPQKNIATSVKEISSNVNIISEISNQKATKAGPLIVESLSKEDVALPSIKTAEKIPGLSSTAEIRRRKSMMQESARVEAEEIELNKVESKRNKSKIQQIEESSKNDIPQRKEIIPGLNFTAEIKRRKSMIHEAAKPDSTKEEVEQPTKEIDASSSNVIDRRRKKLKKQLNEEALLNKNGAQPTKESAKEIMTRLSNTAEIGRRKSMLLMEDRLQDNAEELNDIVPELKSTVDSTQSKTVALKRSTPGKGTVTPTKKPQSLKKPCLESPKIPGFSVIEEMRNRKSTPVKNDSTGDNLTSISSKIPLFAGLHNLTQSTSPAATTTPIFSASNVQNATINVVRSNAGHSMPQKEQIAQFSTLQRLPVSSSVHYTTPLKAQEAPSTPVRSTFAPSIQHTLSSTQFASPLPSAKMPSILRTPLSNLKKAEESGLGRSVSSSAYTVKRPMSCLADDNDVRIPATKLARTDNNEAEQDAPYQRRRSVTFCNRVEHKIIQGDSFNSSGSSDSGDDDIVALQKEVLDNMEKTKNALKRQKPQSNPAVTSHNLFSLATTNVPSIKQYGAVTTINFSAPDVKKKSTSLMEEKAQRRKAQFRAAIADTPKPYNFIDPNTGLNDQLQYKNVVPNDKEISDDEMDAADSNKKSNCSIM